MTRRIKYIVAVRTLVTAMVVTALSVAAYGASRSNNGPLTDFASFAAMNYSGHKFTDNTDAPLLTLTDGRQMQAVGGFTQHRRNIVAFRAGFTYQASKLSNGGGDGVALVFQNDPRGVKALGANGNGLGYTGIARSAAFEINLYNGNGPRQAASEGLAQGITSGMLPPGDHQGINIRAAGGAGRYDSTGVNLRSGHPIRIDLKYNGLTLRAILKDEITGRSFVWSRQIDIPLAVGGDRAYVGFTGASGTATAVQTVSDFSFHSAKPTLFSAVPPVDLVNPFIGTGTGPGGSINLFPGPSMPFGMVQLSPNTVYLRITISSWNATEG